MGHGNGVIVTKMVAIVFLAVIAMFNDFIVCDRGFTFLCSNSVQYSYQ